jgi:membrane protease YdiL (CAAX protease family)
METTTQKINTIQRPFSLTVYLLIVFALSWPFQIAYVIWGTTPTASYLLSSISMVMVTVGTFIAGRYVFRDGFKNAGWHWGKPTQYLWTFGLALLIFAVPTLLEAVLGLRVLPAKISVIAIIGNFLLRFVLTLIPGFGEEFGWRGYMLPHLASRYSPRKAVFIHAFIWWAWHLPVVFTIGIREGIGASVGESIVLITLITLIPSMMNAVIFAYVWTATQSLAVSSVYHSAYDEVRDAIEKSIGFGPLVNIWEMAVTTLLGAFLLWKGNWKPLAERNTNQKIGSTMK